MSLEGKNWFLSILILARFWSGLDIPSYFLPFPTEHNNLRHLAEYVLVYLCVYTHTLKKYIYIYILYIYVLNI
jgi:hypothetical protein